jgi:hypothetical protein
MELILLAALVVFSVVSLVGMTAVVAYSLGLLHGKYYWRPLRSSDASPAFKRVISCLLGWPLRSWLNYSIAQQAASTRLDCADGPVIFAARPHGVLVASAILGALATAEPTLKTWQVGKLRVGVHRALLRIPFLSDAARALGCVSVSEEGILDTLKSGASILVMPGGVREMGKPVEEVPRLFPLMRLAWEINARLVPVYFKGEEELWWIWHNEWHWVTALRKWTKKKTGLPVPIVFLPRLWNLPKALTTRIGQPLLPRNFNTIEHFCDAYHTSMNILKCH